MLDKFTKKNIKKILICYLVLSVDDPDFIIVLARYIQDRTSTLGQDLLGSWIYPGQGLHTKTRSVRELDISRTGPPHYRTRYVRELDVSRTVHSLQDKIG